MFFGSGQRHDTIKLIQKKSNKDFRKGCASSFTGLLVIKERRLNYKPFVTLKDVKTYKSSKSAVLQASDDDHSIDSVLQLGVLLSFTVSETKLSDENIEKNNNNHGHVGKKNKDCQPAVQKKRKNRKYYSGRYNDTKKSLESQSRARFFLVCVLTCSYE